MLDDIKKFFDRFVEDFSSFDGKLIASRYIAPYTAVSRDGDLWLCMEHSDVVDYSGRRERDVLPEVKLSVWENSKGFYQHCRCQIRFYSSLSSYQPKELEGYDYTQKYTH